ncbi:MAG: C4-dicarboxylate ABC transporter, partial [Synergistales bacterium]|nr:C4-dicarboxylate ABC transporter [Synergistales bacterium]
MYHHAGLVLVVVAVVFGIAKRMKVSTELSMFLATLAAALSHPLIPMGEDPRAPIAFVELLRHIVEGSFTYLDMCLILL